MTVFSETLWLNYKKTVRNSLIDEFNYLESNTFMNIAYWDNKEQVSHIYKMRLYENHLGFFSDIDSSKSLENSFNYEFIQNCELNYSKPANYNENKLYHKNCCLAMKINWPGELSKNIDICSLNKHETICIVEIRSLEKTIGNNCKKIVANKKYNEMSKGLKYNLFNNSSINSTFGSISSVSIGNGVQVQIINPNNITNTNPFSGGSTTQNSFTGTSFGIVNTGINTFQSKFARFLKFKGFL